MRCVYKLNGPLVLDGVSCDMKLIRDLSGDIAAAESEGWYLSPTAAKEAENLPSATGQRELDRDELIAFAEGLGIKVDKRWSVARLKQEIDRVDDGAE